MFFRRTCTALSAATLLATAALPVQAQYQAPWSSFDFLEDQRWSQINNRLTDQRMEMMRKDAQPRSRAATPEVAAERSALALGERATTDLSALRSYLNTTELSEDKAATVLMLYRDVANQLGVPANDIASATAAFLAGTYAGYTNRPFPDEMFKPLYEQFADILASDASLTQRPLEQRIEYYQRLVIVGMIFQLTQIEMQQNPDPEQISAMREAAYNAFSALAGTSPDQVRFTSSGLAAR